MVHMAQKLFGPRDRSYTILAIEFVAQMVPTFRYPLSARDHITGIQLSDSAAKNMSQESVKTKWLMKRFICLHRVVVRTANNFEEGIACYFASYYMEKKRLNDTSWRFDSA